MEHDSSFKWIMLVFIAMILGYAIKESTQICSDSRVHRSAIENGYIQVFDKESDKVLWKKESIDE